MSTLDINPRLMGPVRLASTRSKRIACLCTSEIQTRLCLPKPTGKLFQATKITEAKSCLTFAGQLKSNYPILKSLTVVRPCALLLDSHDAPGLTYPYALPPSMTLLGMRLLSKNNGQPGPANFIAHDNINEFITYKDSW